MLGHNIFVASLLQIKEFLKSFKINRLFGFQVKVKSFLDVLKTILNMNDFCVQSGVKHK